MVRDEVVRIAGDEYPSSVIEDDVEVNEDNAFVIELVLPVLDSRSTSSSNSISKRAFNVFADL